MTENFPNSPSVNALLTEILQRQSSINLRIDMCHTILLGGMEGVTNDASPTTVRDQILGVLNIAERILQESARMEKNVDSLYNYIDRKL